MLFCYLLDLYLCLKLGYLACIRCILFFKLEYLLLVALNFCLLSWQVKLFKLFFSLSEHHLSVHFLKVLLGIFQLFTWLSRRDISAGALALNLILLLLVVFQNWVGSLRSRVFILVFVNLELLLLEFVFYCRCLLLVLLHVLVVEARVFKGILIKITLWKVVYLFTVGWEGHVVVTNSWHMHIRVAITLCQLVYYLLFVHFEL